MRHLIVVLVAPSPLLLLPPGYNDLIVELSYAFQECLEKRVIFAQKESNLLRNFKLKRRDLQELNALVREGVEIRFEPKTCEFGQLVDTLGNVSIY